MDNFSLGNKEQGSISTPRIRSYFKIAQDLYFGGVYAIINSEGVAELTTHILYSFPLRILFSVFFFQKYDDVGYFDLSNQLQV